MRLVDNKVGGKRIMQRILSSAVLMIAIAVFLTLPTGTNKLDADELTLYTALEATDAQIEKSNLYAWGKLPDGDWNRVSLEKLIGVIIEELNGDDKNVNLQYDEDREHRSVTGFCQNSTGAFTVVARKQLQTKTQGDYLFINIETGENSPENISITREKIKNIFQDIGIPAQINTCLLGQLDGKLEQDDLTARLNRAFQAINAQVTGKLEQINLVSYNGFSSLIPRYLVVDGQKTNVNMAIRYSPYENRTYITVGSPVITGEY